MEVSYLDTDSANYVKSMMTELLPEGMQLGEYVFFNVEFKVNGETAEPLEPITITVEGSNLTITDTKRANVFYLRKATPEVEGDKDELKEISQRAEVLERLQAAGESTENIEDYDLSEITLREDGTTDKIIFEGRKSTIYGCYVEEKPAEDTTPEEEQPVENPEQGAEEANPETATEVEIISDDVNLRTQPDAEADNVEAVAYTGERYPLLETVEAGEATWYKIQYTNPETGEVAELYVRSDFAKLVEDTVEVTDGDTVDVTEIVTELTYEDSQVSIVVSAAEEGIIPEGAELSVTPITAENTDTQAQYDEVAQHIEGKVAEEEKEVAGFLAYDICFLDEAQNKVEPNGEVKVSMNYKEAVIPEEVTESGAENTEVTVMHLEENAEGEVKQVVDMVAESDKQAAVETTDNTEIVKAEFTTDSFSVYTITWKGSRNDTTIYIHYVDSDGNEISEGPTGGEIVENLENSTWYSIETLGWNEEIPNYTYNHAKINGNRMSEVCRYYSSYMYYRDGTSGYGEEWKTESASPQSGYHIYLVYNEDTTSGGGGGSSATGNLAHRKYVTDKGDGTYDLTLDVTGAIGTETNKAQVDVVLVLDMSGSMDGDNISAAKTAVDTLTSSLKNNATVDSKWKLVTFSNSASIRTNSWVSAETINNTIKGYGDYSPDGGTNYEAGLTQAGNAIGTARQDATKIVVFLTDGQPTYHGDNDRGGGDHTTTADYNGALKGAAKITCDRFYAVGMGLGNNVYNGMSGLQLLKNVADETTAGTKSAVNVQNSDLSTIFAGIAGDIVNYTASNVTITDTLTQEVDVINPNDLKVKVTNKEGTDVTQAEQDAGAMLEPSYDSTSRVLKLDFADNYVLKQDYTYSITATIQPNAKATSKYIQNSGYTDIGEENTGVSSAGKEGFFSNVENSAKVTWTTNDGNKEGAYNRPVVQLETETKLEPVNFFLNLSSKILDSDGNIAGQAAGDFTTSVSGALTKLQNAQGCGVALNEDLRVMLPGDHVHGGVIGVIGGEKENAVAADQLIRKLGEGTYGNQEGQTEKKYQIIDKDGNGAFPTDEKIFEYIRTNWKDPSSSDGDANAGTAGVNKKKNITVNGEPIDVRYLTTDNFKIRWYVFKDQTGDGINDCWHIDGVLVPKSGVLNITKTFDNEEIANKIAAKTGDEAFKINVTGNFLAGTDQDPNTTVTKTLKDANARVVNSDGTVTYTWSLAIFGDSYTVAETNYDTDSTTQWKYSYVEWKYTDAQGNDSSNAENELTTTEKTIATSSEWEDQSTAPQQTFDFINHYNKDADEGESYITVSKTFKGLSWNQIQSLKDSFELIVKKSDGTVVGTLTIANGTATPEVTEGKEDEIQDYTYSWTVYNTGTGKYIVTEDGEKLGDYTVTAEGFDKEVSVSEGTWELDASKIKEITTNNVTNWKFGEHQMILTTLKAQGGYLIWTYEELSSAQKASVVKAINTLAELNTFKRGEATIENCHFHFGDELKDGITYHGSTIQFVPNGDGTGGTLNYGDKSAWQHIATGAYGWIGTKNADIEVVNTYTEKKVDLDLVKTTKNTGAMIDGAEFELFKGVEVTSDGHTFIDWDKKTQVGDKIIVNQASTAAEITSLTKGVYQLVETKAPEAHSILAEPIYFKVSEGIITLCGEHGNDLTEVPEMWELVITNENVLTIKNQVLYDLPSTGGSGIFGYMIGGVALMMAAMFILYKMRSEGVLRS